MIGRGLIIFLIIINTAFSYSQVKVLNKPVNYLSPTGEVFGSKIPRISTGYLNPFWIVYSEGAEITAFKDKQQKETATVLPAFSSFYVVEDKDAFIRVAIGGTLDEKVGTISGFNQLCWVRKDQMILWDRTLFSTKLGSPIHLYPVFPTELLAGSCLKIRTNYPDLSYDSIRFYYPVKFADNKVLLSSTQNLSGEDLRSKILGWFDVENFIKWDGRSVFFVGRKDTLHFSFDHSTQYTVSVQDRQSMSRSNIIFPLSSGQILFPWIQSTCSPCNQVHDEFYSNCNAVTKKFSDYYVSVAGTSIGLPADMSKNIGSIILSKDLEVANEFFQKNLKNASLSDRKKIFEDLKTLFGYYSSNFSDHYEELTILDISKFFSGKLLYAEEIKNLTFDKLILKKKMHDNELKDFLERLEKLTNPRVDVFECSFMILDKLRSNKFRLYK
jgi:hypothetical protein